MKNFTPSTGFALLYAVLLTGIILAIGLGLSAILAKQIILSSTGASSQAAYYAANTGKECVLHWGTRGGVEDDIYKTAFGGYLIDPDSGEPTYYPDPTNDEARLSEITCGDTPIDIPPPDDLDNGEGKVFELQDVNINNQCVRLTVYVYRDIPAKVISTGYNLPCEDIDNPRRVEREIKGVGTFATPF